MNTRFPTIRITYKTVWIMRPFKCTDSVVLVARKFLGQIWKKHVIRKPSFSYADSGFVAAGRGQLATALGKISIFLGTWNRIGPHFFGSIWPITVALWPRLSLMNSWVFVLSTNFREHKHKIVRSSTHKHTRIRKSKTVSNEDHTSKPTTITKRDREPNSKGLVKLGFSDESCKG